MGTSTCGLLLLLLYFLFFSLLRRRELNIRSIFAILCSVFYPFKLIFCSSLMAFNFHLFSSLSYLLILLLPTPDYFFLLFLLIFILFYSFLFSFLCFSNFRLSFSFTISFIIYALSFRVLVLQCRGVEGGMSLRGSLLSSTSTPERTRGDGAGRVLSRARDG